MCDPWCDTNLCKYITTVRSSYSVNSGSHILKLISETQQHYIQSESLRNMHVGSQPRSSILHTKKSGNIIDGPCDAKCKCVCVCVSTCVTEYVRTCVRVYMCCQYVPARESSLCCQSGSISGSECNIDSWRPLIWSLTKYLNTQESY